MKCDPERHWWQPEVKTYYPRIVRPISHNIPTMKRLHTHLLPYSPMIPTSLPDEEKPYTRAATLVAPNHNHNISTNLARRRCAHRHRLDAELFDHFNKHSDSRVQIKSWQCCTCRWSDHIMCTVIQSLEHHNAILSLRLCSRILGQWLPFELLDPFRSLL